MFLVIGGLSMMSHHYTLGNIKSRTVGDGQHGTARWATDKEIKAPLTPTLSPSGKREETAPPRRSEPLRSKVGGASKPSPCCAGWTVWE